MKFLISSYSKSGQGGLDECSMKKYLQYVKFDMCSLKTMCIIKYLKKSVTFFTSHMLCSRLLATFHFSRITNSGNIVGMIQNYAFTSNQCRTLDLCCCIKPLRQVVLRGVLSIWAVLSYHLKYYLLEKFYFVGVRFGDILTPQAGN